MSKIRSIRGKIHIITLTILIIIISCIVINIWVSSNYLIFRNYTVNLSISNGKTLCAVVISDLHNHQFGSNNTRLVEKISGLEPDMIFIDGDMLNSDSDNASVPCSLTKQLKNIAPVYYALGNHENAYISNGHPDFIKQLEESGAVVLDKTYVDIEIEGIPIRLGGMYDYADCQPKRPPVPYLAASL